MYPITSIARKMRLQELQDKPAIVIAAFGSTRRGRAVFDHFDTRVRERYSEYEIFWAFTSAFIRKKSGLPGLHQTLAAIESKGYRKAVVLPLYIFPSGEYREIAETVEYFPGLRVLTCETLMHRWTFIKDVLAVVEKDFLTADEGSNLLVLHGTPLAADPGNVACLGLAHLVSDRYDNVLAASLEGVPDQEAIFCRLARQDRSGRGNRLRIVPLLYLAGMHVEEDLMGAENSWRSALEAMGFTVDCETVTLDEGQFYKSLAFYPEITGFFLDRLERSIQLMQYY